MIDLRSDTVTKPSEKIRAAIEGSPAAVSMIECEAQVGGGTLPRSAVQSIAIALQPKGMPVAALAARLRAGAPPVIGYIAGNKLRIDLRTVFPTQDGALAAALGLALQT